MKRSTRGLLVRPEHLVLYGGPFLRTLTCPSQPRDTSTEPVLSVLLYESECCVPLK